MPDVYQFKDFEGSSHRILIDLVRRFRPGGRLLDLGASAGFLGEALKPLFDRTLGFEYDVDRLPDLVKRFDHAVIADLEKVVKLPSDYNAVVMADVLEHLRNPRHVLELVRESLDGHGFLFLSVPNIANVTIRLGLLFGIFTYRDRGILDHTHLRFYTMKTIRRELEDAGFRVLKVRGSSVPIRLIVGDWFPDFPLRIAEKVLSIMTQLWKALLAYQIIMVAVPDVTPPHQ